MLSAKKDRQKQDPGRSHPALARRARQDSHVQRDRLVMVIWTVHSHVELRLREHF